MNKTKVDLVANTTDIIEFILRGEGFGDPSGISMVASGRGRKTLGSGPPTLICPVHRKRSQNRFG